MAISSNQPMREAEIDLLEAFNDADLSALPGLVETVGDSSAGLVKDVSDLETTVGDNSSGLVKDVSDLETTVGDSSSGLVKDVSDLETTVGDSSSGLVKHVSDLETTVGDSFSGLVKDVSDLEITVENIINSPIHQIATGVTRAFAIDDDSDMGLIAMTRGTKKALYFINRIDQSPVYIGDELSIAFSKQAQSRTGTFTSTEANTFLLWCSPNVTLSAVS